MRKSKADTGKGEIRLEEDWRQEVNIADSYVLFKQNLIEILLHLKSI